MVFRTLFRFLQRTQLAMEQYVMSLTLLMKKVSPTALLVYVATLFHHRALS